MDNNNVKYHEEGKEFSFFNMVRKCLRDVANVSNDSVCLQIVLRNFREFFMKEKENPSFSFNEETRNRVINSLNPAEYDVTEYESPIHEMQTVDLTTKLIQLEYAVKEIDEFDMENVKSYILRYMYLLVEDGIYGFSRGNDETRSFSNIYHIGIFTYKDESFYESVYNPFFLSSICFIAFEIVRNYKSINSIPELREMNYEIFISKVKKCFTRYTCDPNGVICKYYLDDNGIVSSVPFKKLSSIENINPMMLFEEITSYISRKLENNDECDSIEIDIAIIGGKSSGYTPVTEVNKESFNNLLKALILWYAHTARKTKLNLSLTNILNSKKNSEERLLFKYELEENCGKLIVKEINFSKFDYAPIKNLASIIGTNNMLIFLDCPFLSWTSKYEYDINFTLAYKNSYKNEIKNNFGSSCTFEIFKKFDWIAYSVLKKNSYSSSTVTHKNNLCRFMDSAYLYADWFWEEIKKSQKCDDIYFYFSGDITDDTFACYPKYFEIFENNMLDNNFFFYSHSELSKSSLHYNKVTFLKIRVWSFLKYLPQEYSCKFSRKSFEELLGREFNNQESYLEFLRDIFVCFDVETREKINISVEFSDRLEVLLKQMELINVDKIIETIHAKVFEFVKLICKKSIFSDSKSFEDEYLKKSFENCIYENIVDLNTLLFLNIYEMCHKSGSLNRRFKINFYEQLSVIHDNYSNKITDKYFYLILIKSLTFSPEMDLGLLNKLWRANEIFGTTIIGMLHEIEKVINTPYSFLITPDQIKNLKKVIEEKKSN